jgi:hypothetical protein
MTFKTWDRYSLESLSYNRQDERGRLFISGLGQSDLSRVTFLHEGVDTIRQLYSGILKQEHLDAIKVVYDRGLSRPLIDLLGREWLLGSGGKSGYKYRLQDNDLGLILFIGSRYVLDDNPGSHFKIELSPHFIDARKSEIIQGYMDTLASRILHNPVPVGCSVHLCVDVQGWSPPKNFSELLVTRSRRRIDYQGIDSVEFTLAEIAAVYGASQSFLFGLASHLQFSLYRKDLQIKAVDKVHFWESVWNRRTDEDFQPLYRSEAPVWRFEFRFHHSVVKQFSEELGQTMDTFLSIVPHLTGLFRYALGNYRLNAVSVASKGSQTYRGLYIDPMWQLLLQDIHILEPDPGFTYKRTRKKPGQGGIKNLNLAVGNLISLYARHGYSPLRVVKYLMQSGIWKDYCEYIRSKYRETLTDESLQEKILERVTDSLRVRTLLGAAA